LSPEVYETASKTGSGIRILYYLTGSIGHLCRRVQVWYRVIQIVINRDDVQGYAAKTVFEVGSSWTSFWYDKSYMAHFAFIDDNNCLGCCWRFDEM